MSSCEGFPDFPESKNNAEVPRAIRNLEVAKAGARRAELYFAELPEVYERFKRIRRDLLERFRDITQQAHKSGSGIYLHARKLEAKMRVHINDFLLGFFSLLSVQKNPVVQQAFGRDNKMPPVLLLSAKAYEIQLERDGSVEEGMVADWGHIEGGSEDSELMLLYDSPHSRASYRNFEEVVVHEFIHAMVDVTGYQHQSALDEGVTHLIAQRLLCRSSSSFYKARTAIAESLMDLDSEMLITWYFTRDDQELKSKIERKLLAHQKPERAEELANWAVNLTVVEEALYEQAEQTIQLNKDDSHFRDTVQRKAEEWMLHMFSDLRQVADSTP